MKKVMLILMLVVVCSTANASWFSGADKPEKPEIIADQIWKNKGGGDERLVFDVGEKYVIYGYKNESDITYPSVKAKEKFLKQFELVRKSAVILLDAEYAVEVVEEAEHGYIYTIEKIPKKPYLHKNPNNDHWICSKHGDVTTDLLVSATYKYEGSQTISFFGGDTYCVDCVSEIIENTFKQHITGVKEND